MEQTEIFEAERPRLVGIATRVLADHAEAEDVVQQAWLRLDRAVTRDETEIEKALSRRVDLKTSVQPGDILTVEESFF